jgi:putative tryptophan/tyrosine transport system substrate-binding protein
MTRREFIAGLGGAAAWPLASGAQQAGMRRIGWLIGGAENDSELTNYRGAFREELAKLGWREGRDLRIELRFGSGDLALIRGYAAELVDLAPDIIVTSTGATTDAVRQQTQTIPILFVGGGDPVAAGRVRNLARPDGNITGFSAAEPSIAGKWLELLKEAEPRVSRVAIIFIPDLATGILVPSYLHSIEAGAPGLGIQTFKTSVRSSVEIVRAIDAFAAEPNGGLLFLPPPPTTAIRETILQLAAQYQLPTIFPTRGDAIAGALMAYQRDLVDDYRRAASYVDRILRGTKVSELPVQFPTKYQLTVNLKTANALGLTIPETLLATADEVIQ